MKKQSGWRIIFRFAQTAAGPSFFFSQGIRSVIESYCKSHADNPFLVYLLLWAISALIVETASRWLVEILVHWRRVFTPEQRNENAFKHLLTKKLEESKT